MKSNVKLQEMLVEERYLKVNGDIASRYYNRGNELGKGGFAHVFEMVNAETKQISAGKVIQKSSLTKGRTRQKLMSEIKIHRSVHHPGIVNFEHFFEDSDNIYILLELCNSGTLNDKLKRRRRLAELEVQCYLLQLLSVLRYLRSLRVLHRDIKLSNLFINEDMELKLGDFGLACKIEFEGERKRTMCGTPNYIAPEILDGRIGHSFEVDVWSFGIVAYTLLVGRPPFQAEDARATYKRIKANSFSFPEGISVSNEARSLICGILVPDPSARLSLQQIAEHPFFSKNAVPRALPRCTLVVPPSSTYLKQFEGSAGDKNKVEEFVPLSPRGDMSTSFKSQNSTPREMPRSPRNIPNEKLFVCSSNLVVQGHDFVEKWVDYSDKYGLGYKLSNGRVGAHFNDLSKILLLPGKVQYYQNSETKEDELHEFSIENYPQDLNKKVTILMHFNKYMKAGEKPADAQGPYIKKWLSTSVAIIFRLSNRSVHVIFQDKSELLILGDKKHIIFLEDLEQKIYPVGRVSETGNKELIKKMRFTKEILTGLAKKV